MKKKNSIIAYGFSGILVIVGMILSYICNTFGMDVMMSSIISNVIMIAICLVLYFNMKSKHSDEDFMKPMFEFSWGKFFGILGFMVVYTYFSLTLMAGITYIMQDPSMLSRNDSLAQYSKAALALFSICCAPITEEIVYRLFIYNNVKKASGFVAATLFTGFLFGISHMTITHTIAATAFGIAMTLIYELTGRRLFVTVICHMLYNTISSFLPSSVVAYNNIIVVMISFILVAAVCLFGINYVKLQQNNGGKISPKASSSEK